MKGQLRTAPRLDHFTQPQCVSPHSPSCSRSPRRCPRSSYPTRRTRRSPRSGTSASAPASGSCGGTIRASRTTRSGCRSTSAVRARGASRCPSEPPLVLTVSKLPVRPGGLQLRPRGQGPPRGLRPRALQASGRPRDPLSRAIRRLQRDRRGPQGGRARRGAQCRRCSCSGDVYALMREFSLGI